MIKKIIENELLLWKIIYSSLIVSIISIFIYIQGSDWFSNYSTAYFNMRPSLVWIILFSVTSFFLSLSWYCFHFTGVFSEKSNHPLFRDFLILTGFFLFIFLIKYFYVLPVGYGLFVVSESKYPLTASFMNAGIFSQNVNEITTHGPPLYPISLMFSYLFFNETFSLMKIFNALFITSAILPIFFISRQFFNKKISYAIILITSFIPSHFLIPLRLHSENLYLPLLFWILYFIFVSPGNLKYRLLWDALTGILIGFLYLCRYITLAAIPFLLVVWWLKPFNGVSHFFQLDKKKIRNLLIILFLICLTFSPWVMVNLKNGFSFKYSLGFGITENTNPDQLSMKNLIKWIILYLAYFILLASPVLNLLFLLPKINKSNGKLNLWYFLVLALSLAFLIAVVRHSWRAHYNAGIPLRIMGRYLIYFPAIFIITSIFSLTGFNKDRFKNIFHFAIFGYVIPLSLIVFSYFLIIRGSIVSLDPDFILFSSSIDVYYIKTLGISFFIIINLLFLMVGLSLWKGLSHTTEILSIGLILFYLVGEPNIIQTLKSEQYFQKVGASISNLIEKCNKESEQKKDYVVFLPKSFPRWQENFIKYGIEIRNLGGNYSLSRYPQDDFDLVKKETGIIVYLQENANSIPRSDYMDIIQNSTVIELLSGKTYCMPDQIPNF